MIIEADRKVLEKIGHWEKEYGDLPPLLALYKELLNIQLNAMPGIPVTKRFTKSEVTDRLAKGIPVLEFDDLDIDWQIFNGVLKQVTSILPKFADGDEKLSAGLEEQVASRNLKADARLRFESSGRDARCDKPAINEVFGFALDMSLRPFLINSRDSLAPFVEQEKWRKGYCPVCGGLPDFAFLDKEAGARWLMCSRCDYQWLFKRLECPYCGSQDPDTISYYSDDNQLYRVYVCEQCKRYLKSIDLRQAEGDVLLPLERIVTSDLDVQACNNGYFAFSNPAQSSDAR